MRDATARQEGAERERARRRRRLIRRSFSLTGSLVHLIQPMLVVAAEYKAAPLISVTAIAGAGKQKITDAMNEEVSVSAYEVGAQLGYYLIGSFDRGATASLEVVYAGAQTDSTSGEALGILVSPLLGYKLTTGHGLTFNVQAGIRYLAVKASSVEEGADRLESSIVCDLCQVNVNFHAGWSF